MCQNAMVYVVAAMRAVPAITAATCYLTLLVTVAFKLPKIRNFNVKLLTNINLLLKV